MTSVSREWLSSESVPAYEYKYDETGVAIDSVAVGERLVHTYRDSITFDVAGAAWIGNMYYAYRYDDQTYYDDLASSIGDNNWEWVPTRILYEDTPRWNAEYLLYEDVAAGSYRTSTNHFATTWYDDYRCSTELIEEAPKDEYATDAPQTKSRKSAPSVVKVKTAIKINTPETSYINRYKAPEMRRTL